MSSPEETMGLLLVELGAIVPSWLTAPDFVRLEQLDGESLESFGTRACALLDAQSEIAYVVVALAVQSLPRLESGLSELGQRVVITLSARKKARLLLCVPAETAERHRKSLLALAGELAKFEDPQSSVVVGAHFSARPPPSGTLPLWPKEPIKRQENG